MERYWRASVAAALNPFSKAIQRAFHPAAALPQHVRVDHVRGDVIVAQQFLDRADVRPALEGVRGEALPERVRACLLGNAHPCYRRLNGLVDRGLLQLMPPDRARARVAGQNCSTLASPGVSSARNFIW